MKSDKTIDNVTVELLNAAMRLCDINLSEETTDKIIDIVELIEDKGNAVTLLDIAKLKAEWLEHGYSSDARAMQDFGGALFSRLA